MSELAVVNQENLRVILPSKIALTLEEVARVRGTDPMEEIPGFYASKVYRFLENEATKFTLMAGITASQTAVILKHDVSHDTAEKIMDRITDVNEDWVLLDLRKEYVED